MARFITVKFRQAGVHFWPDAPEGSYLRYPHRHEFHFTVWLEVFHEDREVEFIALKEELQEITGQFLKNAGSCEMVAVKVLDYLKLAYPGRGRRCWVEEDGENGAYLEIEEDD